MNNSSKDNVFIQTMDNKVSTYYEVMTEGHIGKATWEQMFGTNNIFQPYIQSLQDQIETYECELNALHPQDELSKRRMEVIKENIELIKQDIKSII